MQKNNKFRKSDLAIPELDTLFACETPSRLRNSMSNHSVPSIDFANYRITISNHQVSAFQSAKFIKQ